MAGGIAGGGIDDFGRAIGKGALHWGAIGHAARRVGVEGGFTLGGGAVGYAATGTMDGALMGASMGQAIGGAFGNFAVACFTAGTPLVVDREGNSRPIDEIEVGDFVLARSEFDPDGPLELKRVEEKFVRTSVVMDLVVHGQSIKTTAEHPFYVPAQGKFVAAGELQVGEQLVGHDGKLVQIESIGSTGEVTTVYNLRVADFHTYFVGGGLWGFDVWVHNATGYRVQGGGGANSSKQILDVDRKGNLLIRAGVNERIHINIGNEVRAKSFLALRSASGPAQLIEFEMADDFIQHLRDVSVSWKLSRNASRGLPQKVDIGGKKGGFVDQYAIPPEYFDQFLRSVIPGTARVRTQ
jgi:hypothetical protein